MREDIVSGTKKFVALGLKVGRDTLKIQTRDGDMVTIALPDGLASGVYLPPAGTVLQDVAVSISRNGDTFYGCYPAKGSHIVKFLGFSHRKGQEPAPTFVAAQPPKGRRTWWSPEKYIFTALLEVQGGDFVGCVIPMIMDYVFDRDLDGTAKFKGTKGKVAQVREFLELCGFDTVNGSIPYSENVLPDLNQMLSETADDHFFQVRMITGESGSAYVDEVTELPAGLGGSGGKKTTNPWTGEDDEEDEGAGHITREQAERLKTATGGRVDLTRKSSEQEADEILNKPMTASDFDEDAPAKPAPTSKKRAF